MKTSALAGARPDACDQSAPRSCGFSAFVTQSPTAAGPQPPRLSSARANNSASFGSFPAVSRVRRFSMQPTAARRAGRVSPWQVQPEIRKVGIIEAFHETKAGGGIVGRPARRSSVTVPNLLSTTPAASSSWRAAGIHPFGDVGVAGPDWLNSPPGR